ncbi:glycosyltransferase family 2 protein [Thiobacillus sp.]
MNQDRIISVIITYCPSVEPLSNLLSALQKQVDSVVVVDNGSPENFKAWLSDRESTQVHGIFLGENRGIAAAQNIGIRWAMACGANYVLLFDQDSLPAKNMVISLLDAARRMSAEGHKLASVGPRYMDARQQNPPPFIQIRGLQVCRQSCDEASSIVPVDYLIASGSLIPVAAFAAVGLMQEDLFIDYVDIEWGLRAKQQGFSSFGVCAAQMQHDLGDEPIKFASQVLPVRSPLRHYYLFRNAVWLYTHTAFPFNWKLADGWRLLLKYVFYSLFAKPRLSHWRMMTLGVWHGLVGKTGKFEGVAS